jgi:hypothetical protein
MRKDYKKGGVVKKARGGAVKKARGGVVKKASGGAVKKASGGAVKKASGGAVKKARGGVVKKARGGVVKKASGGTARDRAFREAMEDARPNSSFVDPNPRRLQELKMSPIGDAATRNAYSFTHRQVPRAWGDGRFESIPLTDDEKREIRKSATERRRYADRAKRRRAERE